MDDSLETHCLYCSERFDTGERTPKIIHDTGTARKHISCTSCLKKIVRDKKTLVCPECNTAIDSSVEELPSCHVDDDITTAKQVVDSTCIRKCSNCGDSADFRCKECHFYLCNDCKPGHSKNKSFRHHDVRELSSLTQEEVENFQEVSMCERAGHGLPIDMYCPRCEVPCCLRCDEHVTHSYVKLTEIVKQKAEAAKKDGKLILRKKDDIAGQIQLLEEKISAVAKKNSAEEDLIQGTVRGIIQAIEQQGKVLLDELHKQNNDLVHLLEMEVRKRKGLLDTMESIEDFLRQEKKEKGPIQELKLYKSIEQCSADLKDTNFSTEVDVSQEASYFVPNKELDFERAKMGFIHSSLKDDDRGSLKGYTGPESIESDIRILIIGKKRSGRTTTSFALMGQETRPSSRLFIRQHKNKTFKLRRSPGIGPKLDISKEKDDISEHLHPGPNVLLFTIRNPDDDVALVNDYMDIFKDDVIKYLIIVFTGKRELDRRKMTVDKYVQSRKDGESQFGRLLSAIGVRYVAVNTDNKDSYEGFRDTVFKLACDVVEANSNRYLSLR